MFPVVLSTVVNETLVDANDVSLGAACAALLAVLVSQVELGFQIKKNTPNGGGYIPKTQMAIILHVVGLQTSVVGLECRAMSLCMSTECKQSPGLGAQVLHLQSFTTSFHMGALRPLRQVHARHALAFL